MILLCFIVCGSPQISALTNTQKRLFNQDITRFDAAVCGTTSGSISDPTNIIISGETTGPPKAVQKVVWNALISAGVDSMHAAAVMGNIDHEGSWNPESTEIAGPTGGKPSKDPSSTGSYGYGLIGWTPGASDTINSSLTFQMKELGLGNSPPYTAETQAAVIVGDIFGKTSAYPASIGKAFLNTKTIDEATTFYQGTDSQMGFENPADKTGSLPERLSAAKRFLREYGGSSPTAAGSTSGSDASGNCCSGASASNDGNTTQSDTLTGQTNAEKIFNYLIDNEHLTDNQAAGAVGSMMLESGGNTLNIDPTATNPGSGAYGIAQWLDSRKTSLVQFAAKKHTQKSDLLTQIQYLMTEMESNINLYNNDDFKKQKTLGDAVKYWTDYFEGLVNSASQQYYSQRLDNAKQVIKSSNGGETSTAPTSTSSGSCACPASSAPVDGKTVVIDPGHGPNKTTVDQATGLTMVESDNQPEGHDVWEVANKIKDDLSGQGYNIILTKKSEDDNVTFRQRAEVADSNHAALALSIHGDPGLPDPGEIFVQKVGLYRGSGSNKTVFSDADVAQKSQQYAQTFKEERAKAQSENVVIKDNSFNGRAGLEPGNISMVQLFSKTPWVYNEQKMSFNNDKYAEGLENAIKQVVGSGQAAGQTSGDPSSCNGAGAVPGDLLATVKNYAWEDYSNPKTTPKPVFKAAIDKASSQGQYVGQVYTDCGGFVTRAMIDSGYEPNYNYSGKLSSGAGNTINQGRWLAANWQKLSVSTTKDLLPGDVAISSEHTYMYVRHIDGFNGDSASASQGSRTPMASDAYDLGGFNWYRKK